MSGFKDVLKGGWHPEKSGSAGGRSISLRGDFKGVNQIAGLMGKDKDSSNSSSAYSGGTTHASRPLTSLRDPDSFGPPPKHIATTGLAPSTTSSFTPAETKSQSQLAQKNRPPPPPRPYQADTTGLQTKHLPPPPVRRDVVSTSSSTAENSHSDSVARPVPALPPRRPSRAENGTPPPSYDAATRAPEATNIRAQASAIAAAAPLVSSVASAAAVSAGPSERAPTLTQAPQSTELQQRLARMRVRAEEPEASSSRLQAHDQSQSHAQPPRLADAEERAWGSQQTARAAPAVVANLVKNKAPPPPPPPKKKDLVGEIAGAMAGLGTCNAEPPPVPVASKPRVGTGLGDEERAAWNTN